MSPTLPSDLRAAAAALAAKLVEWRRALHRHPELGFEERWTSAFVKARLDSLGIDVRDGLGETGLAGILRASRPRGGGVLLRADMDALPIQEVAGRDYGSEIDGRMHACGHDGHMAMLLGAAELLVAYRGDLPRDVVFCFQPAEDFAYFLRERPGAFVFVGAGNAERGIGAPHHSPAFDIDESALPLGAELLARLALDPV